MKPLSKATRQDIEKQMREQYLEPSEGWFTKGEMLEVLAAESYWREAVKNARGVHCPFCRPEVTIDAFWRDKKSGPIGHAADCPYLIAQEE